MKTFKEVVGKRIQAQRLKAGFSSQQALADAIGIDRARVSDWERGVHEPKGELRATLLRVIGASVFDIFGAEQPQSRIKEKDETSLTRGEARILEILERRLPDNYGEIELELKRTKAELQSIKSSAFWQAYERATPGRRKAVQELLDVVLEEGASRRVKRSHGQEEP